jgi:hypothetical protein
MESNTVDTNVTVDVKDDLKSLPLMEVEKKLESSPDDLSQHLERIISPYPGGCTVYRQRCYGVHAIIADDPTKESKNGPRYFNYFITS